MGNLLSWLKGLFSKCELEIAVVGLQGAGKSTFVQVISDGTFKTDMIPTMGLNMLKVTKNNVSIKIWDLGGQNQFVVSWERYCRGSQAIVFVVDAADSAKFKETHDSLDDLLNRPSLSGIPLLVLANKYDLREVAKPEEVKKELALENYKGREIAFYAISCKSQQNIDVTLKWLLNHSKQV